MSVRPLWVLEMRPSVTSRPMRRSRVRISVVLPDPMSPVMAQKPAGPARLYSRMLSASECLLLMNRKSGSGSSENGFSFSPKKDSYMPTYLVVFRGRWSGLVGVQQCTDDGFVPEQMGRFLQLGLGGAAAARYQQHRVHVGQEPERVAGRQQRRRVVDDDAVGVAVLHLLGERGHARRADDLRRRFALGLARRQHDQPRDARAHQTVLQLRLAAQIVVDADPWLEAEFLVDPWLAQVEIDQQDGLIDVERDRDREVGCGCGDSAAEFRTRHRQR